MAVSNYSCLPPHAASIGDTGCACKPSKPWPQDVSVSSHLSAGCVQIVEPDRRVLNLAEELAAGPLPGWSFMPYVLALNKVLPSSQHHPQVPLLQSGSLRLHAEPASTSKLLAVEHPCSGHSSSHLAHQLADSCRRLQACCTSLQYHEAASCTGRVQEQDPHPSISMLWGSSLPDCRWTCWMGSRTRSSVCSSWRPSSGRGCPSCRRCTRCLLC